LRKKEKKTDSNQTNKQTKSYRLDKYRENQQNAARKWTEQNKKKKKNSTHMNKCPYEWRLTYNIQNRNRTKTLIHTHTPRDYLKTKIKVSKKNRNLEEKSNRKRS